MKTAKKITTIRLSTTMLNKLKNEAISQNRSLNNLIEIILSDHLEATKENK